MRLTLFGYVLRTYIRFALGIAFGLVLVFVVVDFVDRVKIYEGPGWVADAAKLYGYKALMALQQLGPAALLLAAGTTVSALRKQGEVTAIGALTFGPTALYVPVLVFGLLACLGLVAFDEFIATHAGRRVDEITSQRFNRWGDLRSYSTPKQWFRKGERIFILRAGGAQEGFENVSIFTVSREFKLQRRLDAARMEWLDGNRWRLTDVVDRTFNGEQGTSVKSLESAEYELGIAASAFRIRPGRPEQMRVRELREQIVARREVGLATKQFELALHNRFAYPLAALPAALLGVGLALRNSRKGHLTAAIVEGLLVAVAMWGLMMVCRTLVLTERLSPPVAAWTPPVILVLAAAALWLRREGFLHVPRRWLAVR
ncbi:LptF/LptG family permease [Myxococcus sp. K38C18041901]|uniref:LptF/LptG family permease n=1 Tax=Myxococcus guangdongensis TaxID=2906760 RepID=UPI0020A826D8|nr:LptF/LptG family permease [Myxococcus guangdongensis]MCP3062373.1 LptF/LptG family permease [Myxococcus guangdongensis]